LNAPIAGVIATQRSLQNLPYSDAEIAQCTQARLDVLTLGAPAGNSAAQTIAFALRGDAFVIGSDSADVVERESGSARQAPHPLLQPALLRSIPEIKKQIGESLTATLAGES
jgi:hypothetical protein